MQEDIKSEGIKTVIEAAATEVFYELGSGHSEAVYEAALEVELLNRGFDVRRQVPCPISYKGVVVGVGYIDILIGAQYVLELKVVTKLTDKDETQVKKYLEGNQKGILINFNPLGAVEVVNVSE